MSRHTASEQLFEEFCERKAIKCLRVGAAPTRTPDYDVFLPRRKVVVEVKEVEPNPAERAADAALRTGKNVRVSITPGQRIRGKIADALPQLKARTKRRFPGLLVLYEGAPLPRHVDEYQVRVAMFGFEAVVFAVPDTPRLSPYPTGRKYGGGRKMTPDHSTSMSAIGVLSSRAGCLDLTIYHNPHAKVPLRSDLVAKYQIRQFKLGAASSGTIANWEEINEP